mgnify:CR=1 FL=1
MKCRCDICGRELSNMFIQIELSDVNEIFDICDTECFQMFMNTNIECVDYAVANIKNGDDF